MIKTGFAQAVEGKSPLKPQMKMADVQNAEDITLIQKHLRGIGEL